MGVRATLNRSPAKAGAQSFGPCRRAPAVAGEL
jgi:hypothetical protein